MDISSYIASGILENYCLGFCSEDENAEVKAYADQYEEIRNEIRQIRLIFERYALSNQITPSPSVKFAVMENIYRQQVVADHSFLPLFKDNSIQAISGWIADNPIEAPATGFDNLYMQELPSTPYVTNFIVWSKEGHDTEMHTDFFEYLFVVKGSCTMYFGTDAKDYTEGDIICIPPHIHHQAVVTSALPMLAIVQRQACA